MAPSIVPLIAEFWNSTRYSFCVLFHTLQSTTNTNTKTYYRSKDLTNSSTKCHIIKSTIISSFWYFDLCYFCISKLISKSVPKYCPTHCRLLEFNAIFFMYVISQTPKYYKHKTYHYIIFLHSLLLMFYDINISKRGFNLTQDLVAVRTASITIIANDGSVPSSMYSMKLNFKLKTNNKI